MDTVLTSANMTNKTQGRPPRGDQEAIEQAQQRIRDAGDIDALRSAQAVLLPLLGLSLDEAAAVIGKSRFWVSRTRNAALAGKPPPKSHGGRRTALVPADEELELLRLAIKKTHFPMGSKAHLRASIREVLANHTGREAAESTITEFLNRNAPRLVPGVTGADLIRLAYHLYRAWHAQELLERAVASARAGRGPA